MGCHCLLNLCLPHARDGTKHIVVNTVLIYLVLVDDSYSSDDVCETEASVVSGYLGPHGL